MLRALRIPLALALLVLVVVAVLLATEVVAIRSRDVPVPPAVAAPEEVVRAFLDALDAHDCDTAEELWVPSARDQAADWCDRVAAITHVRVSYAGPGGWASGPDSPGVAADFVLRSRPFHDNVVLPYGPIVWGFSVHREDPEDPWRIDSEGVG